MGNHREKKLGPLAFGYTEIGITHMKMQWKLLLQVDYSNVIGMNLVNFAFTNEVALAEVMTQMYALYLEAKRHKDENAFIAMVLIEQYMPLLEQNYYVSVYLMWYIEFLLQGEVDPRVFTKIVGIDKELFQLLVVQDDPEAVEILKYKLIPSICRCYEAKKGLVEVTLKAVWAPWTKEGCFTVRPYADGVEITGCDLEETDNLVIPETIDGKRVRTIGKGAFEKTRCKSLVLPKGLYQVSDGAFRDLSGCEEVGFPVFARAVVCGRVQKTGYGALNVPVNCAGTSVNPGDIIVGDENGVCVIPLADAEEILARAQEKVEAQKEKERMMREYEEAN